MGEWYHPHKADMQTGEHHGGTQCLSSRLVRPVPSRSGTRSTLQSQGIHYHFEVVAGFARGRCRTAELCGCVPISGAGSSTAPALYQSSSSSLSQDGLPFLSWEALPGLDCLGWGLLHPVEHVPAPSGSLARHRDGA
jgi:hypothetical protein